MRSVAPAGSPLAEATAPTTTAPATMPSSQPSPAITPISVRVATNICPRVAPRWARRRRSPPMPRRRPAAATSAKPNSATATLPPISAIRSPYVSPLVFASMSAKSGPARVKVGSATSRIACACDSRRSTSSICHSWTSRSLQRDNPTRQPHEQLDRWQPLEHVGARSQQQRGLRVRALRALLAQIREDGAEPLGLAKLAHADAKEMDAGLIEFVPPAAPDLEHLAHLGIAATRKAPRDEVDSVAVPVDAAQADELAVEPDVAESDDADRLGVRQLGQRAAGDVVGSQLP